MKAKRTLNKVMVVSVATVMSLFKSHNEFAMHHLHSFRLHTIIFSKV